MIKKLLTLIAFGAILSFIPPNTKENVYTLTEGQMILLYNTNLQVKQILPTSQAPAIQVTNLNAAIDSIQKVLSDQYKKFNDTLQKKK